MADFPLFEVLLLCSDDEWECSYSKDTLTVRIKPQELLDLLEFYTSNEPVVDYLKDKLWELKDQRYNKKNGYITFEVNAFNQIRDISLFKSRISFLQPEMEGVNDLELDREMILKSLIVYSHSVAKRLEFRDEYLDLSDLYHFHTRHLTTRYQEICQHLYVLSGFDMEKSAPASQSIIWSKLLDLIKMLCINPLYESMQRFSTFNYEDKLAVARAVSQKKKALSYVQEVMDDLDEYELHVCYEQFFSVFLQSLPFRFPSHCTFSAEEVCNHLDADYSMMDEENTLQSAKAFGEFLDKDLALVGEIKSINQNSKCILDDLLKLFPKLLRSYLGNYKIQTEKRHSIIQYWHHSVIDQLNEFKAELESSEFSKLNKDMICFLISQSLSCTEVNTTVAYIEDDGVKIFDNSPSNKSVIEFKPEFKNQMIGGGSFVGVAEVNGFVFEFTGEAVHTFPYEAIDRKSYLYKSSEIKALNSSLLPTARLERRLEKKRALDSSIKSISFHQDFDPNAGLGFMGFHVGYKNKKIKGSSGKAKVLEQIKKIGICDQKGKVTFHDIEDESLIDYNNHSFYMKYAQPFSSDIVHSPEQINEWVLTPPSIKEVFKEIRGLLKRVTFNDKYASEYLALWVMGTYFYRSFPTYPKVVLNELPGQDSMFLMALLSRLCFNGRALSEDDREVGSLLNIINMESPTLCIYAVESRSATKRGIVELLNYKAPHRDIKALKSGKAVDQYCPVIHSINRFDVKSDDADEDSIRINIKKIDTRGIELDSQAVVSDRYKAWALANMNKVASASKHILNNSETTPRYLAMETMAQVVQADGHRNLKNAVSFYEEKVNNQLDLHRKNSVEMALAFVLLTTEDLWKESKETVFIPSDMLKRKLCAGAPKKVRDSATPEKIKDIFMSARLLEEKRVLKSTRNDMSSFRGNNPKNGFEIDQTKLKKFAENLGKDVQFIRDDGTYTDYLK